MSESEVIRLISGDLQENDQHFTEEIDLEKVKFQYAAQQRSMKNLQVYNTYRHPQFLDR